MVADADTETLAVGSGLETLATGAGVWLNPLQARVNAPTKIRNNVFILMFRSEMPPGAGLDSEK